jgi:hypothetical protein
VSILEPKLEAAESKILKLEESFERSQNEVNYLSEEKEQLN